jgi:hypothetical protein
MLRSCGKMGWGGTVSFVQEIRSESPQSHEKTFCLLSLRA